MNADDFRPHGEGLQAALAELIDASHRRRRGDGSAVVDDDRTSIDDVPVDLPDDGIGPRATLEMLAPPVLDGARDLAAPGFFGHMDPPTPWITWAMHQWTASRNQNLLHPDTAPVARQIESRVIDWLAPVFEMSGGHMAPGSSVANLTALWAAREAGATAVVASHDAHLSVRKAAHLLGMEHRAVDDWDEPGDVADAVAVITAGTTSTGEIEPLTAAPTARWRHVDAAWSGPLRLSDRHRDLLGGIGVADSVAVSAHKWLFQPKESALVLFADHDAAHESISVGADYLTVPNVGLLGSHGATAVPLLATLLAYGRRGIADMIDRSMDLADRLGDLVDADDELVARSRPQSGIVCWRHRHVAPEALVVHLPAGVFVSTTTVDGEAWLRSVAANPFADPEVVVAGVLAAASAATA